MARIRIGISGWNYPPWRGVFYPPGLRHQDELRYAASQIGSIEINGTFYSTQRPASFARWHDETPADFVFAVKGPRFITHMKKLRDCATPLANFVASGVLRLGPKLGPILWQLPPSLGFDADRLAAFFALLPRDTEAVAGLARGHDHRLKVEPWLTTDARRPIRHALEVRHASFATPAFAALLRAHDIGLVVADTAGRWPFLDEVTADFVYVRLHGDQELYVSGYTAPALARWATRVAAWTAGGRDVYVYFDNDVKVRAPYDAMRLAHRLGLRARPRPMPAIVNPDLPRTIWPGFRRA